MSGSSLNFLRIVVIDNGRSLHAGLVDRALSRNQLALAQYPRIPAAALALTAKAVVLVLGLGPHLGHVAIQRKAAIDAKVEVGAEAEIAIGRRSTRIRNERKGMVGRAPRVQKKIVERSVAFSRERR